MHVLVKNNRNYHVYNFLNFIRSGGLCKKGRIGVESSHKSELHFCCPFSFLAENAKWQFKNSIFHHLCPFPHFESLTCQPMFISFEKKSESRDQVNSIYLFFLFICFKIVSSTRSFTTRQNSLRVLAEELKWFAFSWLS